MSATAAAERNGADSAQAIPAPAVELPVDCYKHAAPFLRRPFTPEAVKFKVQATWEGGALVVAYIDARLAIERLNLVCPHLWAATYSPIGNEQMWCHLTVDGITRSDVGEGKGKGLVSDAFKRAAVPFGVGVSLYAIPKMRVFLDRGQLEAGKDDKYKLTPKGEMQCRNVYAAWLESHGEKAFGQPLDHGDVPGAVGDAEVEGSPTSEFPGRAEPGPEEKPKATIEPERAKALEESVIGMGLNSQKVGVILNTCGISGLRAASVKALKERLASLDEDEAARFEAELARLRQDADAEAPQADPEEGATDA